MLNQRKRWVMVSSLESNTFTGQISSQHLYCIKRKIAWFHSFYFQNPRRKKRLGGYASSSSDTSGKWIERLLHSFQRDDGGRVLRVESAWGARDYGHLDLSIDCIGISSNLQAPLSCDDILQYLSQFWNRLNRSQISMFQSRVRGRIKENKMVKLISTRSVSCTVEFETRLPPRHWRFVFRPVPKITLIRMRLL